MTMARAFPLALALVLAGCSSSSNAPTASSGRGLRTTSRIAYYHGAIGAGPTVITRGDGTILDERRYEPFGAGIGAIDYALDPHNVLNKESDPATGWSDHGARWMAPETGRWLTPDPPVKAPDPKFMREPWALHPYQYVEQNPVLYWDPDGHEAGAIERGAQRSRGSTAQDDTPGQEVLKGFKSLVPGLGQMDGLKLAIAPLQSKDVSTPVKVAYAIVAPIPVFILGVGSEFVHVTVGLGHIVKGTARASVDAVKYVVTLGPISEWTRERDLRNRRHDAEVMRAENAARSAAAEALELRRAEWAKKDLEWSSRSPEELDRAREERLERIRNPPPARWYK